jgi:hypothetical protein
MAVWRRFSAPLPRTITPEQRAILLKKEKQSIQTRVNKSQDILRCLRPSRQTQI